MIIPEELLRLSVPSFGELIRKGEALMIPLIVLNTLSWTIIIDRAVFWTAAGVRLIRERRLLRAFQMQGRGGGLEGFLAGRFGAIDLGRKVRGSLLLAPVIASQKSADDRIWEDEMDTVLGRSERFLFILSLIATLSTSFGLFGTVVGVSWSLNYIESDFSQTVSGLSVALYTTIGGLAVSIVAIIAGGIYSSLSGALGRAIVHWVNVLRLAAAPAAAPVPAEGILQPAAARPARGEGLETAKPYAGGAVRREDTLEISPSPVDLSKSDIIVEDV